MCELKLSIIIFVNAEMTAAHKGQRCPSKDDNTYRVCKERQSANNDDVCSKLRTVQCVQVRKKIRSKARTRRTVRYFKDESKTMERQPAERP